MSSARHRANTLIAMTAVAATLGLAGCSKTAPGLPAAPSAPTAPTMSDPAPAPTDPSPSPTVTDPASPPSAPGTGTGGSVTAADFGGIVLPPNSTLKNAPLRTGSFVTADFTSTNPEGDYNALKASAEQNGFTIESTSGFNKDLQIGVVSATKGGDKYYAIFTDKDIMVTYTKL